jgi:hypothetical protein
MPSDSGLKTASETTSASQNYNESIMNIVEQPIKTLEMNILAMDACRMTKQESMAASLLNKMDVLLGEAHKDDEISERLLILENNDKALFDNVKNQDKASIQFSEDTLNRFAAMTTKIDRLHDMVTDLLDQTTKNSCVNEKKNQESVAVTKNKKKKKKQTESAISCRCSEKQLRDASTQTPVSPSAIDNDKDAQERSQRKKNGKKKADLPKTHSTVPEQHAPISDGLYKKTIEQFQQIIKSARSKESSIDTILEAPDGNKNDIDSLASARQRPDGTEPEANLNPEICTSVSSGATSELGEEETKSAGSRFVSTDDTKRSSEATVAPATQKANDQSNMRQNAEKKNSKRKRDHVDARPTHETQVTEVKDSSTPGASYAEKSNTMSYRKKNVLLIADDAHRNFDSSRFSRTYEVKKIYYKTIEDACRNKEQVLSNIRNHRPEIVFIHLGINDVMQRDRKPFPTFKNNLTSLIATVFESTDCKICVSQIIPIPGKVKLNADISFANKWIDGFISELRQRKPNVEKRLWTIRNEQLGGFIERYVNEHGEAFRLSARGQAKLWLRLRDALNRTDVLSTRIQSNSNRNSIQNE